MEKSCGCVVFNDDKVLLVKQISGICGFPKGHVEDLETEEETAIRETLEETGINVLISNSKRYCVDYLVHENVLKTVVYFVASAVSFDIKIQEEELISAFWVPISQVYDYITFDNLKQLWLEVLEDRNGKVDI